MRSIFTFLLAGSILCYSCSTSSTNSETPSEPIEVSNNGVKIAYESYGEGEPTILLVHGWCINQDYWKSQVEALKPDYRIVTMDLPGFGESGMNRSEWTIENYGEDVSALINQLNLSKVVLVGHSMGGNVVVEAAAKNDKVIAVIGIDNFKDVGTELPEDVQQQVDDFLEMLEANFAEIAPAYAEGSLFHSSTDSLVKQRVMKDFAESNPESAMGSLRALMDYGSKEQELLGQLKQPLYLINSNASPTNRAGLDSTGIDFTVIEIDSTGHYPMIEKPELFNDLLRLAIKKIKERELE